ncbi:MAG: hypothetical protein OEZ02_09505, partial [Anaerolineae bacterium]|nr:hypothetical protein [Anaerolineae bacterium]
SHDLALYRAERRADIGLYFYGSRWYDPSLGRFTQADTLVPEKYNPAAFDHYAYVYNNPIRYNDPTGHKICDGLMSDCGTRPPSSIPAVWSLNPATAVGAPTPPAATPTGTPTPPPA